MNMLGWAAGPPGLWMILAIGIVPLLVIISVVRYFAKIRSDQNNIKNDLNDIKKGLKDVKDHIAQSKPN